MTADKRNWQWWYSDNEERWNGPCLDRDEAIEMGRDYYDDESFMVMEACQGDLHLHLDAYTVSEWLDENNHDLTDPDGDTVLVGIATEKQQRALVSALNIVIDHWIVENNIHTKAWSFKAQRNQETIPPLEFPSS